MTCFGAAIRSVCIGLAFASVWPAVAAAQAPHDGRHYTAFFDETVTRQLDDSTIAGAVVAIVENGAVVLLKGYGVADQAARAPVDPDNSMFRIASVSKLFTALAVMQLVEDGVLDLDADVSAYLDFEVTAPLGPVTLRHLLTHRAGFEDFAKNRFLPAPDMLQALGAYVQSSMPGQIYAPGSTPAYSSYSFSLAGHIVERASGMTFQDYVAESIFAPLGMTRSSFLQPLPDALAPYAVKGYGASVEHPRDYEIIGGAPQGGMAASGADMARFMLSMLDLLAGRGQSPVAPATLAKMLTSQSMTHPALGAMGLGFYQSNRNGLDIWGHSGSSQDFRSQLLLVPDKDVGFFTAFSGAGTGGRNEAIRLSDLFLDAYFPSAVANQPMAKPADLSGLVGRYRSTRRADTTVFALLTPLLGDVTVASTEDGGVTVSSVRAPDGDPIVFYPVGDGLFQSLDTQQTIAFGAIDGRIVLQPPWPVQLYVKGQGIGGRVLVGTLALIASGSILGGALLVWRGVRWRRGVRYSVFSCIPPLAAVFSGVAWAALYGFFLRGLSDYTLLSSKSDALLAGIYALAAISVLLTGLSIVEPGRSLTGGKRTAALWPTGVFLSSSMLSVFLFYRFGVLRFSMQY